ncbi:Arylsulfatase precursor [Pirellulimonas nuda]|uniref:Arylsulfatase n=1 Tax=Pirellulimonas nuda TaxID=2528009 RepID=A0A518D5E3_9BACT|nr:sulfatase-like hydrolase/transferase [Pirellulimonas nuda]QDU86691.1 Arylsulfatase precursor [Pirellulimonas nuda]
MNRVLLTFPTGCALALTLVAALAPAAQAGRPNVLVVVPDDLSYDDYSHYNQRPDAPRTPNVDQLVDQSVRLTDFHVATTCAPSRAQLMTGRHNNAAGVWHTVMGRYFLDADEVTMADVFKANGYRTGIFGKWHLGESYPFRAQDRGFEHVVIHQGGGIDQQPSFWGSRNDAPCRLLKNGRPVDLAQTDADFATDYFTAEAIGFMRGCHAAGEPFFAYVPYNVAHLPHDMPPGARPGADAPTATIENLDANVGRLMRFLDTDGLADDTLVVFILGDNGRANARFRGDKATEYEAGHRVPCLIRWPAGGYAGAPATARDVTPLVSAMDLLPTFMDVLSLHDVAGRSADVPLEGRSLKTLLDTDDTNNAPFFNDRVLVADNQRLDDLVKYKQACVMQDQTDAQGNIAHKWRLMRPAAGQPWELYDVQADPRQENDLLAEQNSGPAGAAAERLRAEYEEWWREASAHASEYGRPIAGSAAEPEVCLYSHDWHMSQGLPPWNQTMIAEGPNANGFNAVAFARGGDYAFDLRRWPREIADETTVSSALREPIRSARDNTLTRGKALPVRAARIRVWNGDKTYADERQEVAPDSDGALFTLPLPAGPAMVQTWFYDADGKELCGAYYDYVRLAKP